MKAYYEDYVNHMLRHYYRCGKPDEKADTATQINYDTVNTIVSATPVPWQNLLRTVYTSRHWYDNNSSLRRVLTAENVPDPSAAIMIIRAVTMRIKEARCL